MPISIARRSGGRGAGSSMCPATACGCSRAASRISAGCGCSRSSARWRRMPGSRPSGSARTSSATPSPRICCRAAPTCACCSRCWAMPTSRPPKSTPMSTARGWSSWSTPATRSRRASLTAGGGFVLPARPMLTYLDFEKPIAELEPRVAELRETASSRRHRHRRRSRPARGQVGQAAARHLCQADAVAEGAGRAPSGTAALQGLCCRHRRGFRSAGRRPRVRRRPGDHRRPGAHRRPPGDADRA